MREERRQEVRVVGGAGTAVHGAGVMYNGAGAAITAQRSYTSLEGFNFYAIVPYCQ